MIVNGYYEALKALLTTGDPDKRVTKVGFGIGTAAATPEDTALTDAFIKPLAGFTEVPGSPRLLRFSYLLGRSEAVGMMITEIGLFTEDETLVARKVRSAIEKTADLEIGDSWELYV